MYSARGLPREEKKRLQGREYLVYVLGAFKVISFHWGGGRTLWGGKGYRGPRKCGGPFHGGLPEKDDEDVLRQASKERRSTKRRKRGDRGE